jgi:hypothetical protein
MPYIGLGTHLILVLLILVTQLIDNVIYLIAKQKLSSMKVYNLNSLSMEA